MVLDEADFLLVVNTLRLMVAPVETQMELVVPLKLVIPVGEGCLVLTEGMEYLNE